MSRHTAAPDPAQASAEPGEGRLTPYEDVNVLALLLLAYVKEKALTRTDQDSERILVRRDILVRLDGAIERAYPGELERLRRKIDAPTEATPAPTEAGPS